MLVFVRCVLFVDGCVVEWWLLRVVCCWLMFVISWSLLVVWGLVLAVCALFAVRCLLIADVC